MCVSLRVQCSVCVWVGVHARTLRLFGVLVLHREEVCTVCSDGSLRTWRAGTQEL